MTSTYPASPDLRPAPVAEQFRYWSWGPIVAGAIAATALALVLHSFAAAIGLAVTSTAPTWRDASFALALLSGLYVVLATLAAYGFGGYVAGLLRTRAMPAPNEEVEFRDGMHGLLVWALATLLIAAIGLAIAGALPRLSTSGGAGAATSVARENLIAFDLDRLFRSERRTNADLDYPRAEAARILLTTSSHRGMQPDDRAYLVRLVAAQTGLAQPDAERRVDEVAARAKDDIARARRSAVVIAFAAAAGALLGAAVCWSAACAGGRGRDGAVPAHVLWDWRRPIRRP
jgi:hypothetical protein